MVIPIYISIIALVISITSLGFSAYFGLRDRPRLKTKCILYHPDPDLPWPYPSIHVEVVNVGRRITILRLFGSDFEKGQSSAEYLSSDLVGLPLGERQLFQRTLRWGDQESSFLSSGEDPTPLTQLWVQDTVGRKVPIQGSREVIAKFWKLVNEEQARQRAEKERKEREAKSPAPES